MLIEDFSLKNVNRIYLDHNATTPLAITVQQKVGQWSMEWGNPSSIHQSSRGPKQILRSARISIAEGLGCHPLELIFTSGGSEGNSQIIQGVYQRQQKLPMEERRTRYLYSAVEHPSVVKTMQFLKSLGADVQEIKVKRSGELDWQDFESKLNDQTALVSIMFANNETGNIFPVKEIAKRCHQKGALYHSDSVQALGKFPVDLKDWGVDFATFSGHKFYSLKGSGIVFVKSGVELPSLIFGGGQERGRRAGTENVLPIASLSHMMDYLEDLPEAMSRMGNLRDYLQDLMQRTIPGISITGGQSPRLCNSLSVVIDGIDGETLLMNLDIQGISVSTGAACSSGNPEPSPVLLAMGLSREEAQSSLRLSLGWGSTQNEIETFVGVLVGVVERVRRLKEQSSVEELGHASL
ncbi:MAG: cysteine desulfurase [Bdellovibrionaceae bacterium]|nr:cysteine desulfurase [Pseudobdellovibrionaceae bacterium]|tara:strand:- start:29342 stop:30565 length:1224 start_codon:yes stop_codon:yes gene_type:complete